MRTHSTKRPISRISALAAAAGFALALGLAGPAAVAEPIKEKVDLEHVSVHFNAWHGGFSPVTYLFRKVNYVNLTFDPTDVSKSKVEAEIDTTSLDSNHYFRDNFTRSPIFLDAMKHPTAKFVSTSITKTGDKTGKMTGNMTIVGVTKEVTFDVTYNKGGPHRSNKFWIDGFSARTTFKRSDFGIKQFIPWIGDEVEVVIHLEAQRDIPK